MNDTVRKPRKNPPHGMIAVWYFSTRNRVSPFVALIGDWPDRAAMIRTVKAGTCLGWRPAIKEEIELLDKSTRHASITWRSVRDMLWTHRSPDLDIWYSGMVERLRKHSRAVKGNLVAVQKKIDFRMAAREATAEIVAENRAREKAAADPQLRLFQAA